MNPDDTNQNPTAPVADQTIDPAGQAPAAPVEEAGQAPVAPVEQTAAEAPVGQPAEESQEGAGNMGQ